MPDPTTVTPLPSAPGVAMPPPPPPPVAPAAPDPSLFDPVMQAKYEARLADGSLEANPKFSAMAQEMMTKGIIKPAGANIAPLAGTPSVSVTLPAVSMPSPPVSPPVASTPDPSLYDPVMQSKYEARLADGSLRSNPTFANMAAEMMSKGIIRAGGTSSPPNFAPAALPAPVAQPPADPTNLYGPADSRADLSAHFNAALNTPTGNSPATLASFNTALQSGQVVTTPKSSEDPAFGDYYSAVAAADNPSKKLWATVPQKNPDGTTSAVIQFRDPQSQQIFLANNPDYANAPKTLFATDAKGNPNYAVGTTAAQALEEPFATTLGRTKAFVQDRILGDPNAAIDTLKNLPSTPLSAFGEGARNNLVPTLGGAYAAAQGAAFAAPFGGPTPVGQGAAAFIGGGLGMLGGSALIEGVERGINHYAYSPDVNAALDAQTKQLQSDHPEAYQAGQLATMLTLAKPSLQGLKAGTAVATQIKNGATVADALASEAGQTLQTIAKNSAVGGASASLTNAGVGLAQGNAPTIKSVATDFLAGSLLSEPTSLGTTIHGGAGSVADAASGAAAAAGDKIVDLSHRNDPFAMEQIARNRSARAAQAAKVAPDTTTAPLPVPQAIDTVAPAAANIPTTTAQPPNAVPINIALQSAAPVTPSAPPVPHGTLTDGTPVTVLNNVTMQNGEPRTRVQIGPNVVQVPPPVAAQIVAGTHPDVTPIQQTDAPAQTQPTQGASASNPNLLDVPNTPAVAPSRLPTNLSDDGHATPQPAPQTAEQLQATSEARPAAPGEPQPLSPPAVAFRDAVTQAFKLSPERAQTAAQVIDANAQRWAGVTGKPVTDYFNSRIAEIKGGDYSSIADAINGTAAAPETEGMPAASPTNGNTNPLGPESGYPQEKRKYTLKVLVNGQYSEHDMTSTPEGIQEVIEKMKPEIPFSIYGETGVIYDKGANGVKDFRADVAERYQHSVDNFNRAQKYREKNDSTSPTVSGNAAAGNGNDGQSAGRLNQSAEHSQTMPTDKLPWQMTTREFLDAKVTKGQMLARGADGHLDSAVETRIPISKIDGREPIPAMEGGYIKGTPVTQPVEAVYNKDTDKYTLYAGNHRVRQAEINGESTVPAFVEGLGTHASVVARAKANGEHGSKSVAEIVRGGNVAPSVSNEAGGGLFGEEQAPLFQNAHTPTNAQDNLGFYSHAESVVMQKMGGKMPADALAKMLQAAGVKPDEMKYTGLGDFLATRGSEPVTRGEVMGHLNDNGVSLNEIIKSGSATKFGKWALPGGTDYREHLLQIPYDDITKTPKDLYRSSHWSEPNVVAHFRTSDRTGPNGEKVLHVDEIQSDINNTRLSGKPVPDMPFKGKEYELAARRILRYAAENGYDSVSWTPGDIQAPRYNLSKRVNKLFYDPESNIFSAYQKGRVAPVISQKSMPDELPGIVGQDMAQQLLQSNPKRSVSEIPVDSVIYNPARGQLRLMRDGHIVESHSASQYQIENHIGATAAKRLLDSTPTESGVKYDSHFSYHPKSKTFRAYDMQRGGRFPGPRLAHEEVIPQDELPARIGEDAAQRLLSAPTNGAGRQQIGRGPLNLYTGEASNRWHRADIKDLGVIVNKEEGPLVHSLDVPKMVIGGSGKNRMYDEMLPSYFNKMGKPFGVTVGRTKIDTEPGMNGLTRWNRKTADVPSIDITPAMREHLIDQGTPMFQGKKAGNAKASVTFLSDQRAVIQAFKGADVSSAVHEIGHIFRRDMYRDMDAPNGNGFTDAERSHVEDWAGVKDADAWRTGQSSEANRAAEEKFARGFERYLRDGKSPTAQMAEVFAKMATWLKGIYHSIKGGPLDVHVSPEMHAIFGKFFGGDGTVNPNETPTESTPEARQAGAGGRIGPNGAEYAGSTNTDRMALDEAGTQKLRDTAEALGLNDKDPITREKTIAGAHALGLTPEKLKGLTPGHNFGHVTQAEWLLAVRQLLTDTTQKATAADQAYAENPTNKKLEAEAIKANSDQALVQAHNDANATQWAAAGHALKMTPEAFRGENAGKTADALTRPQPGQSAPARKSAVYGTRNKATRDRASLIAEIAGMTAPDGPVPDAALAQDGETLNQNVDTGAMVPDTSSMSQQPASTPTQEQWSRSLQKHAGVEDHDPGSFFDTGRFMYPDGRTTEPVGSQHEDVADRVFADMGDPSPGGFGQISRMGEFLRKSNAIRMGYSDGTTYFEVGNSPTKEQLSAIAKISRQSEKEGHELLFDVRNPVTGKYIGTSSSYSGFLQKLTEARKTDGPDSGVLHQDVEPSDYHAALTELGAHHIEAGSRTYGAWKAAMGEDLAKAGKPASEGDLLTVYRNSKKYLSDFNKSNGGTGTREEHFIDQVGQAIGSNAGAANFVNTVAALPNGADLLAKFAAGGEKAVTPDELAAITKAYRDAVRGVVSDRADAKANGTAPQRTAAMIDLAKAAADQRRQEAGARLRKAWTLRTQSTPTVAPTAEQLFTKAMMPTYGKAGMDAFKAALSSDLLDRVVSGKTTDTDAQAIQDAHTAGIAAKPPGTPAPKNAAAEAVKAIVAAGKAAAEQQRRAEAAAADTPTMEQEFQKGLVRKYGEEGAKAFNLVAGEHLVNKLAYGKDTHAVENQIVSDAHQAGLALRTPRKTNAPNIGLKAINEIVGDEQSRATATEQAAKTPNAPTPTQAFESAMLSKYGRVAGRMFLNGLKPEIVAKIVEVKPLSADEQLQIQRMDAYATQYKPAPVSRTPNAAADLVRDIVAPSKKLAAQSAAKAKAIAEGRSLPDATPEDRFIKSLAPSMGGNRNAAAFRAAIGEPLLSRLVAGDPLTTTERQTLADAKLDNTPQNAAKPAPSTELDAAKATLRGAMQDATKAAEKARLRSLKPKQLVKEQLLKLAPDDTKPGYKGESRDAFIARLTKDLGAIDDTNPDTRALANLVSKYASTTEKNLVAWYRAGLLSGPGTIGKIGLAHTLSLVAEEMKRAIAAPLSGGTREGVNLRANAAALRAAGSRGFKEAGQIFLHGDTAHILQSLHGADNFHDPKQLLRPEFHTGIKPLDAVVRTPMRVHSALYHLMNTGIMERGMMEQAALQARGPEGGGHDAAYWRANPTEAMIEKALAYQQAQMFMNDNRATTALEKGASALGPAGKLALNTLMPFNKVPLNLGGRAAEYTLGPLTAGYAAARNIPAVDALARRMSGKEINPDQKGILADQFGRGVLGSAILGTGYLLAKRGTINAPDAKKHENGSFNANLGYGDRSYGFGQIQPVATPLLAGAILANGKPLPDKARAGASLLLGDNPFVRASGTLQDILGSGQTFGQSTVRGLGEVAGSFVPTGLSQTAAQFDPSGYSRKKASLLDYMENRTPFLRNRLPLLPYPEAGGYTALPNKPQGSK